MVVLLVCCVEQWAVRELLQFPNNFYCDGSKNQLNFWCKLCEMLCKSDQTTFRVYECTRFLYGSRDINSVIVLSQIADVLNSDV